jgi:TorA maturation chaperone TorD
MSVPARCLLPQAAPLAGFRRAVAEDLMALAVLHDRELDRERILSLWDTCYTDFLGLRLVGERARAALALFRQGLTDIPASLDERAMDVLAAEYADIYLNHGYRASPCESVWMDEDHLTMQGPMFRIRDVYRRHGMLVSDWRRRTDDHLVHQLQFLSHLLEAQPGDACLAEAAEFLDQHTLRWVGDFANRISARCATRFYAGLAQLTAAYLEELRELLAEVVGAPRPSPAETEERMREGARGELPGPFVPGAGPSW